VQSKALNTLEGDEEGVFALRSTIKAQEQVMSS
jgi:hypothetical protein